MKLPSPALIVATAALFVALGGTSYAVMKLPNNSVGSAQIKDGSVLAKDLNKTVAGSLGGKAGAKGDTGSTGPAGLSSAKYVFDGNGTNIGDLISVASVSSSGSTYNVRIGSHIFLVDSNGTYPETEDRLVYTGPDCTGELYTGFLGNNDPRNSGNMYSVVQGYVNGVMRAYARPASSKVTFPAGTVVRYANSCIMQLTTVVAGYTATNNLTPVTLPTLVPPLTIGS